MSDSDPGGTGSAAGSGDTVSTAFLARLSARARLRRWSRTRVVLVVLGTVTAVVLLAWVVLGSSLLAVRTVDVQGATPAVRAAVRTQVGDLVGRPLARVDTAAVARRVAGVRAVGEVSVTRAWPNTLRIRLVPRRVVAYTASTTTPGGFDLLDGTGVVVSTADRRPGGRALPVVVVGHGVGARAQDGAVVLAAAPASVRAKVVRVDVVSGQDIRLTLRHGVQVRWGSTDSSARKAAVLAALAKHRARVYDVSAPDLPTTRR